jgi:Protein of unknown function (DUF4236)
MGWHYRRRLRLFPGVSLNLGRRGFSSVSVGNRRVHYTIGIAGRARR